MNTASDFVDTAQKKRGLVDEISMLGEPTAHPALRIVPDVTYECQPSAGLPDHRECFSGEFTVVHVPTGHCIAPRHGLPLVWLRRFARLLGESGLDWDTIPGDFGRVSHPAHTTIRRIREFVFDCRTRGLPVDPMHDSYVWYPEHEAWGLTCANPRCEDGMDSPQYLWVDEDATPVIESSREALSDIASGVGWDRLGARHWLCDKCAVTHVPGGCC